MYMHVRTYMYVIYHRSDDSWLEISAEQLEEMLQNAAGLPVKKVRKADLACKNTPHLCRVFFLINITRRYNCLILHVHVCICYGTCDSFEMRTCIIITRFCASPLQIMV